MHPTLLKNEVKQILDFLGHRVRRFLVIDIVIGLLWFAIESSFIFIIQGFLVSINLLSQQQALLPNWYPTNFQINIVILLVFGLLRTLLVAGKNYLSQFTCQVFIREKRELILSRALLSKHKTSHQVIISSFSETVAYGGNFVVHLTQFFHGVVVTVLFAIICFKVAPFETLTGILVLLIFLIPLRRFSSGVNQHGEELHNYWKFANQTLLNGLKNSFFLRLHGMLRKQTDLGASYLKDYEKTYHYYSLKSSLVLGAPQFIGVIVLCFVAMVSNSVFHTSSSALLSFFYLFIRFAQSASQTSSYLSYLRLTKSGFDQLRKLISEFGEEVFETTQEKHRSFNEISFKANELKCGYAPNHPLFGSLNFSLQKSELLLIKGPSGAGKSTLLRTLVGEISPLSGSIFLNDSEAPNPSLLSSSIAYVGPEPFMIYDNVRNNLLYGNNVSGIKDEDIWNALERVELAEQIRKFPNKLEEILLDETQLSSGQKQRLSLARALLRRPQLLVLDEATSNLDPETEDKIIKVIKELKKSTTTFVISHKNTFDQIADNIIVLGEST